MEKPPHFLSCYVCILPCALLAVLTAGCGIKFYGSHGVASGAAADDEESGPLTTTLSITPTTQLLNSSSGCKQTFTVKNTGAVLATTDIGISEGSDPGDCITVFSDNCTNELIAPGGSCTFTLFGAGCTVTDLEFTVSASNTNEVTATVDFDDSIVCIF